uniref:Uncharacterized protein n=1 Tax=Oryza rufipogon TaxID=4529 RepID=A0A679BBW8_ORYRU|nr:hypothetical protein [Oryza rufipogon]
MAAMLCHSPPRRPAPWQPESVEEKPLSIQGLVRINTEDFRFPKSGVYSSPGSSVHNIIV